MNPGQIRLVLVEPSFGGNLGSVARGMANLGVEDLRLVGGVSPQDNDARRMAVNARYLLDQAKAEPSLAAAVADCALVIGTTARPRKQLSESKSLWELGPMLTALGPTDKVALVLGRERIGLTNEELALCNLQLFIPTFGTYASLNLAQAALLLLYECSKTYDLPQEQPQELAPASEIEGLKTHLFEVLEKIGYLKYDGKDSLWLSFSDLIARTKMSGRDVGLVRGVFNRIEVTLKLKSKQ
ncbi:MAG: hypothetical protein A2600_09285 [Candidatus Lambdaproteobacteria bacterium RIFOXYD1_FULL_56_27]|uniref:tRNA/rRNA methyltransferase SpoU type domain-containing protein n=1 Tax=Candidatus Lambdaproteobacteria bacterium RIFOXYD2_FULL_56_26 TaxID=1817773 RepID=A0A1F6GPN2_9PROT|nr:MAG: hypothetical protein A2557_01390 [Candidatus Lambdaproteobacteria bacterium RIFOXYD2_FULL_56_26]OGH05206.1 MAG: hypothetical protein A2426_00160 [Candidatus Lambdaproteobacteria bacterium RIFOXYC1_FULL_56_13]OGH09833.1 MAG: hypothetical protein A2600_09285 [Candidatus Lambdaproteobacteria bacterium RIFOXYD1_FULL_56_27]